MTTAPASSRSQVGVAAPRLRPYAIAAAVLFAAVVLFLFFRYTWGWHIIGDTAEMHYIVRLLEAGRRPYADITDMNLPGVYLEEKAAILLFGWSDHGWRVYELFLYAVLVLSSVRITGRRYWYAGVFGASVFFLFHLSDGSWNAVERDEVTTVLVAAAFALLWHSRERQKSWVALPAGFLLAMAVANKPMSLLLDVALCACALWGLRSSRQALLRTFGAVVAGHLLALAAVIGYLVHNDAVAGLIFVIRRIYPLYAASDRHSVWMLVRQLTHKMFTIAAGIALVLVVLRRVRVSLTQTTLLLCSLCGVVTYFLQAKGYEYHQYPYLFFSLLWTSLVLFEACELRRYWVAGVAGLAFMLLGAGNCLQLMRAYAAHPTDYSDGSVYRYTSGISQDLVALGGQKQSGKVVCLELVGGCMDALMRLNIPENTSYVGDMYLFAPTQSAVQDYFRARFLALQKNDPADVVVLGNEWFFREPPTFHKLDTWPEYLDFLNEHYVQVAEGGNGLTRRYKILVRKGSDAEAIDRANPVGLHSADPIDSDR